MATFDLTTTPLKLTLKPGQTGTVVVVVSNRLGRPFIARVDAEVNPASARAWVAPPANNQRQFTADPAATHNFEFKLTVPPTATPQAVQVTARVVDPEHPDEALAVGDAVAVSVVAADAVIKTEKKGIPWWIWPIAAVVLLGIGVGIFLAIRPKGVPNVVNQPMADATDRLMGAGFDTVRVQDTVAEEVGIDLVLRQEPEAKTDLPEKDSVTFATIVVNREAAAPPPAPEPGPAPAPQPPAPGPVVVQPGLLEAKIWRYTGTPCSGNACPGWQALDRNSKTVALAAAGNRLFQLHSDGAIWGFTGQPCSAAGCPGWLKLDHNSRTKSIVASGSSLYQLHGDGSIWRHTDKACTGASCPGWQKLDHNSRTTALAADGSLLYQLHSDGAIWRYTGTPCSASGCPGWQKLDNNARTKAIASAGNRLYQLHSDGAIWRYTGQPCSGASCPGWQKLDHNPRTTALAADGTALYQLHNDGAIWRYTGTPCSGAGCPGWQKLDHNSKTRSIVAGGGSLYQRHSDGAVWRYTGTPCSGAGCTGWQKLDQNSKTKAIVAGAVLYQMH